MEALLQCCAGLDVHQKTIAACVLRVEAGGEVSQHLKVFATMTRDIKAMGDWLAALGVKQVAMESTGVLWKPVFNLLEDRFTLMLCNARHLKQVPGRKTDVKDCEWIATLLLHGLLRGSYVPARTHRELRDLCRLHVQFTEERTRVANRIHKTLEDANIKLGAVATDILGVSGRAMLGAIARGETCAEKLADLAEGRLRAKLPELRLALEGGIREHHRFLLDRLLRHLEELERLLADLDQRTEQTLRRIDKEAPPELPFARALEMIDAIPGINRRTAINMLAEIGTDMKQFPTHAHLSSWAGRCPGNNESAGKRRSGKTTKGNRWLARASTQAAWAAARSKNSYFSAQYRRLAGRRGRKRAVVAVSHSLLTVIHAMLKNRTAYRDLGADFFDRMEPDRLTRYYVKRLEQLGHTVQLDSAA